MKKLGLIGGTGPESTIEYYRGLVYDVRNKLGKNIFPPLTIESLSVFEVLEYCRRGDYDGLVSYLAKGFENLAKSGADFAALTGITPHIVFNRLEKASPIPLVSMPKTACTYARKQGFEKIALLGTLPTMNGSFFKNDFENNGIKVLIPNEEEKIFIGSKIETELELGKIIPSTKNRFKEIAERLISEGGAEAIVLGCTELPLIFEAIDINVPYIDVMKIHIEALTDIILEDRSIEY